MQASVSYQVHSSFLDIRHSKIGPYESASSNSPKAVVSLEIQVIFSCGNQNEVVWDVESEVISPFIY